jgi:hypothetical protein
MISFFVSDDEVHKLVMDTFNETGLFILFENHFIFSYFTSTLCPYLSFLYSSDADGDGNINYAEFSELVHKWVFLSHI